jgi:hypothetical protein
MSENQKTIGQRSVFGLSFGSPLAAATAVAPLLVYTRVLVHVYAHMHGSHYSSNCVLLFDVVYGLLVLQYSSTYLSTRVPWYELVRAGESG